MLKQVVLKKRMQKPLTQKPLDTKATDQSQFFLSTTETQYNLPTSVKPIYTERFFNTNYPGLLKPVPSSVMTTFPLQMTTHSKK